MLYLKNTSWWLRSFTGSLFCSGTSFGPEEVILFPEIGREKILFSLTRLHNQICIRIYISEKKKKRRQKAKETKEEKRISAENLTGFDDIMCVCVYVYVYVCVCVCVCVCVFPSTVKASPDWKNSKCNARDRPSILCSGNDSVTSTFVATS